MRQVIAGCLLIATGSGMLWVFLKIWCNGIVYIVEPRIWMLTIEIILMLAIIIYGFVRAINGLRKARQ